MRMIRKKGQVGKMATSGKCNLILGLSVALAAILLVGSSKWPTVECQELEQEHDEEQVSVESRQEKGANSDLTETINQLEQMDKFFSELARPRFGRSEFKQRAQATSRGFAGKGKGKPVVVGQPLPYRGPLIDLIRSSRLWQKYRNSAAFSAS